MKKAHPFTVNHPALEKTILAQKTFEALRSVILEPVTELQYTNPFELLVAVLLSAQCTDARVNMVTPALFSAFPTPEALSKASRDEVLPYIQSVTFPNNKATHLAKLGRVLVEKHGGTVPASVEEIEKLPGCGHKTAEVVASVAFGIPAFPVDTHVFRVSNRIGLASGKNVKEVETQLKALFPKSEWSEGHHLLILHGRYTCKAQNPNCNTCVLQMWCAFKEKLDQLPPPITGLKPKSGAYFCAKCQQYSNHVLPLTDSDGLEQVSCPACGSTQLHTSKTGKTTLKVMDYRV